MPEDNPIVTCSFCGATTRLYGPDGWTPADWTPGYFPDRAAAGFDGGKYISRPACGACVSSKMAVHPDTDELYLKGGWCEFCGDGPTCIVCRRGIPDESVELTLSE